MSSCGGAEIEETLLVAEEVGEEMQPIPASCRRRARPQTPRPCISPTCISLLDTTTTTTQHHHQPPPHFNYSATTTRLRRAHADDIMMSTSSYMLTTMTWACAWRRMGHVQPQGWPVALPRLQILLPTSSPVTQPLESSSQHQGRKIEHSADRLHRCVVVSARGSEMKFKSVTACETSPHHSCSDTSSDLKTTLPGAPTDLVARARWLQQPARSRHKHRWV